MQHPERKIFQIYYSDETRAVLDRGFTPLNNLANPRPDWYEAWPILEYFDRHGIDDDCWYGFLSPRFHEKTHLRSRQVHHWVDRYGDSADVIVFSQPLKRRHPNVFAQAEQTHPGISAIAQRCFDRIGLDVGVQHLPACGDRAVFSHFFVAKGWFWRRWRELAARLVALAEDDEGGMSATLNTLTAYREDAPEAAMKVFIVERLASVLMAMDQDIRVVARRPVILRKLLPRSIRRRLEPVR